MDIFTFITAYGMLTVLYTLLWVNVMSMVFAVVFSILRIYKIGLHISRIIGYYLFVSIASRITIEIIRDKENMFVIILYVSLSAYVIFASILTGIASKLEYQQEVMKTKSMLEYIRSKKLFDSVNFNLEYAYLIGYTVLFILLTLVPFFTLNPFTLFFSTAIFYVVDNYPFVAFLIALVGANQIKNLLFISPFVLGYSIYSFYKRVILKE